MRLDNYIVKSRNIIILFIAVLLLLSSFSGNNALMAKGGGDDLPPGIEPPLTPVDPGDEEEDDDDGFTPGGSRNFLFPINGTYNCNGPGNGTGNISDEGGINRDFTINAHGYYAGPEGSVITMRADGGKYMQTKGKGTCNPYKYVGWGWDFGDGWKYIAIASGFKVINPNGEEVGRDEYDDIDGPDSGRDFCVEDIVTHRYELPGVYTVTVYYGPLLDIGEAMGQYSEYGDQNENEVYDYYLTGNVKITTTKAYVGVEPPDSYFAPLKDNRYYSIRIERTGMLDEGELVFYNKELLHRGKNDNSFNASRKEPDLYIGVDGAYVYMDGNPEKYFYNYGPVMWDYINDPYCRNEPNGNDFHYFENAYLQYFEKMTLNEKFTHTNQFYAVMESPSNPFTNDGGSIAFHRTKDESYSNPYGGIERGWHKVSVIESGELSHYWFSSYQEKRVRFDLDSSTKNENIVDLKVKNSEDVFVDGPISATEGEIITLNLKVKNPYPIPDRYGCYIGGVPKYNLEHKFKGPIFLDILESSNLEFIDVPDSVELIKDGKAIKINVDLDPEQEINFTFTVKMLDNQSGGICLSTGSIVKSKYYVDRVLARHFQENILINCQEPTFPPLNEPEDSENGQLDDNMPYYGPDYEDNDDGIDGESNPEEDQDDGETEPDDEKSRSTLAIRQIIINILSRFIKFKEIFEALIAS